MNRSLPLSVWTATLIALSLAPAAPAVEDPSNLDLVRIEGEDRDRDAGQCARTDRESMTVHGTSQDKLFFPHDDCWAEWDAPLAAVLSLFLYSYPPMGSYSGVTECVQWVVDILGVVEGRTKEHCGNANEGYGEPELLPVLVDGVALRIPRGDYLVRVTMIVTEGPEWANGHIDYLGLDVNLDCLLGNAAPAPGALTSSDGLSGQAMGWPGLPYTLGASPGTDPDDDPVRLEWSRPDGDTHDGPEVTASFNGVGAHRIVLLAIDDPVQRNEPGQCPPLLPRITETEVVFQALPNWRGGLELSGEGCPVGSLVPLVTGQCLLATTVDPRGASPELTRVTYVLDGIRLAEDLPAPHHHEYDGAEESAGLHTLVVTARAEGDIHGRVFEIERLTLASPGLGSPDDALP